MDSVNPLAFFSNADTKSMEDEVDDLLSDDEEYINTSNTQNKGIFLLFLLQWR